MMKKITTSLILATSLFANYNSEVTATIGGNYYEGGDLKHSLAGSLRYGIFMDKYISELEIMIEKAKPDMRNTSLDTDLTRYGINSIYNLPKNSYFKPYVLVGGGFEEVENELRDKYEDSTYINYGAGVRYELSEKIHLKSELRHLYKTETESNDLAYSVGVSYQFGEKSAKIVKEEPVVQAPVVVPQPPKVVKEEPKVVVEAPKKVVILDSDGDGVLDNVDKCPNTSKKFMVNEDGCEKSFNFEANFDTDKAIIKDEFKPRVESFAKFLKENAYDVEIQGHTDDKASDAYNQKLSQKRANAIKEYLVKQGIDTKRISTVGYGESKPIATNKTEEGRYKNRRVIAVFIK